MTNKKGQKLIFSYRKNSLLLLWIIGIFLFSAWPAMAAPITETDIIALTNIEREKFNLPALYENELLTKAAYLKAQAILQQQFFSHTLGDKTFSAWVKEQNYRYEVVGENLAIHFKDSEPLFNAWIASPTHKQNILNEGYKEIGVATLKGLWNNEPTMVVVSIFARPQEYSQEQTVPFSVTDNTPSLYTGSTYLQASDLKENYFNSIDDQRNFITDPTNQTVNIKPTMEKNKTASSQYFNLAVKIMLIYSVVMILALTMYFYIFYFLQLSQKMQIITKQYNNR